MSASSDRIVKKFLVVETVYDSGRVVGRYDTFDEAASYIATVMDGSGWSGKCIVEAFEISPVTP